MEEYTFREFLEMECPVIPCRSGPDPELVDYVLAECLLHARSYRDNQPRSFNTAYLSVYHDRGVVEMVCDIYPEMKFEMPVEEFVSEVKRRLCEPI
ncbi:MAG: hypothetical protein JW722_08365 [Demequinaceae bacterium]|nr:hypothetical protein [Demequinaceae bacterium]